MLRFENPFSFGRSLCSSRRAGDDGGPPPLFLLLIFEQAADVPVEPDQFGVHGQNGPRLGLLDAALDFLKEDREVGRCRRVGFAHATLQRSVNSSVLSAFCSRRRLISSSNVSFCLSTSRLAAS